VLWDFLFLQRSTTTQQNLSGGLGILLNLENHGACNHSGLNPPHTKNKNNEEMQRMESSPNHPENNKMEKLEVDFKYSISIVINIS
jgi:hypothetical protein